MQDIVALLAYSEPESSPVGMLMSQSQRDSLAIQLNAAIMTYQNLSLSSVPALETLLKQLTLVQSLLPASSDIAKV